MAQAVAALPDDKREYILGYAEGVIAMRNEREHAQAQDSV